MTILHRSGTAASTLGFTGNAREKIYLMIVIRGIYYGLIEKNIFIRHDGEINFKFFVSVL
jgi:hypothetical protein